MTNSQRFGGRLLHFWPLSTMNWPEACIARAGQMHVHGDKTHRYIHTHTHTQNKHPHKNMPTHAHSRDKLDSITEKGEAEMQDIICLNMLAEEMPV